MSMPLGEEKECSQEVMFSQSFQQKIKRVAYIKV